MEDHRIAHLERHLRLTQAALLGFTLALVALVTTGSGRAPWTDEVRTRSLVVVDEAGNERVVIGAPVPDPADGRRISPQAGIVINDEAGYERFGLGLQENGRVVMGFDAPPGTGDDRNRERITIVADEAGGAYLRFLNTQTSVVGRLILTEGDEMALEFTDVTADSVTIRRLGMDGSELVRIGR